METFSLCNIRASFKGCNLREGCTITSRAPDDRAKKRSTTLGSKVKGDDMKMISSAVRWYSSLLLYIFKKY